MPQAIKRICLALAAVWAACAPAVSQTDARLSQYYEVPTYYNPAAVGRTDFVNIRGGARLQWVGIDNAPQTFLLTADMPFKVLNRRIGLGLVANSESIGLYRTLAIDAQFAFKLRKWGGEFSAAIQLGMYDQSFRGSEVILPDDDDYHQGTDDGVPTRDLHGTAFDLGAGLWYEHRHWWAGVSCRHITSPVVTLQGEQGEQTEANVYEFQAGRAAYFMAGGNIPVRNTLFEIMPSVMAGTDFSFFTAEITARARYNRFLSFGVGYRWKDAFTVSVAAEIKNFFIGYAYDYPVSEISRASSGSHELFAGYRLKLNLGEKNRNRHKSIRIM